MEFEMLQRTFVRITSVIQLLHVVSMTCGKRKKQRTNESVRVIWLLTHCSQFRGHKND